MLAVGAFLVVRPVLLFLLGFSHVVLHDLHVRVKRLVDLLGPFFRSSSLLLVKELLVLHDLFLQPFLLLAQALLVLVNQLLLGQDLLVVVELNLLDDYEVVPVDIVLCHFLVAFVLCRRLRDALLLVKPKLALLPGVDDLLGVGRKGLIPVEVLAFWNKDAGVGFDEGDEVAKQTVSWLQEIEPRVPYFTFSEALQELLPILCDELGGQFNRFIVYICELWMLHLVLIRWRWLCCCLLRRLEL